MLCGFMFPLWGTKLIFLSYTYSAASTKRWSSDIYTVRSWGSHTHADTQAHTSQMQTERSYSEAHTRKQTHVGAENNGNSRKRVFVFVFFFKSRK